MQPPSAEVAYDALMTETRGPVAQTFK